jgi:hypothetical protein
MQKSIYAPLAAVALAVGLAGCVPVSSVSERDDPAPAASAEDTIAPPSFAPEPEADPEPVGNLAFGDAATYEDGLSISVSAPAALTPSEWALTGAQPHNVQFTVTVTNGTTANFDGYVFITATSGGAAAEEVYDSENGLGGSPSGVILPGQTITFPVGFNVADPASIVLSVTPGFDYDAAIFTNAAA